MSTHDTFWLVWNPERLTPRMRHESERGAIAEAERLAGIAPGQSFYVLEALCFCRLQNPIVCTRLDSVPF